ncbi:MAG: sugar phosphate isomerase/epimerase family protein [Acidobacteriaceae bacterium]
MYTRRNFLRSSSISVATLAMRRFAHAAVTHRPIGVQLYTVRALAEKNLPTVLAQIQQIGYQEVETYWNVYTHPAKELRQMIQDHGLRVPSGHFDYDGLSHKLDYARELGVEYVVCPMLPKTMWNSLDGFKKAAAQFNVWGEQVQKMGMHFAFHNHDYEFQHFGDTTGYDTLLAETDPKLVSFEMDCYWITQAGHDPVTMLEKHASRIHMLHLKDRKPGFPPSYQLNAAAAHFTEVGTGTIDWKKILAVAERQRVSHMFVEQDETAMPPMESLRISYQNIEKLMA